MSEVTAKRATGHHGCGASAPAAKKRNILLVGHAAGDTLFGAERSFLDLLAAIDPQQYDVFCAPRGKRRVPVERSSMHQEYYGLSVSMVD